MERLTKRLEDGQAIFHECHGTCGTCDGANCYCIGPMVARLAAYEDTGLEPEEIADFMKRWEQTVEIGGMIKKYCIDHIRDLLQAEQEGRLVVLPCGTDVELVRDGHAFKADHWNHTLTAFRDAPENKSGKQIALFSTKEAEAALAGKGDAHEADSV